MKKIIIVLISILLIIILLIGLYFYGLTGYNSEDIVNFNIRSGASKKEVINNLYKSKLLKSRISGTIYLYLNEDIMIQPGTYELKRSMGLEEILNSFKSGGKYRLTLVEGKRLVDYVDQICEMFNFNKDEVIAKLNDQDYLKELIKKYDFLDNSILNNNIYYPLEGYLYPATYNFSKHDTIEDIIEKILDKTEDMLDNYITQFEKSDYSYHEILTIASIIENETKLEEDKKIASEVIYKRLDLQMSLGMDVTTYYGVRKKIGESLTTEDLNDKNPYNTRITSFIGLPIGPICNPSLLSIDAALNPSNDDYVYFFADIDGKLHFAKTYEEHQINREKYRW